MPRRRVERVRPHRRASVNNAGNFYRQAVFEELTPRAGRAPDHHEPARPDERHPRRPAGAAQAAVDGTRRLDLVDRRRSSGRSSARAVRRVSKFGEHLEGLDGVDCGRARSSQFGHPIHAAIVASPGYGSAPRRAATGGIHAPTADLSIERTERRAVTSADKYGAPARWEAMSGEAGANGSRQARRSGSGSPDHRRHRRQPPRRWVAGDRRCRDRRAEGQERVARAGRCLSTTCRSSLAVDEHPARSSQT